jgi:hypothetical protein
MKMDRNINPDGCGKYAIVNLRRLDAVCSTSGTFDDRWTPAVMDALRTLEEVGALEWGIVGKPDEFFLLKLKDRHSRDALYAYANSVNSTDREFAAEVLEMAARSGVNSPWCKEPD